jgi:hypothetical protein
MVTSLSYSHVFTTRKLLELRMTDYMVENLMGISVAGAARSMLQRRCSMKCLGELSKHIHR